MPISTKDFVASLIQSGLLTAEEIREVQESLSADEQGEDLMSLARELVKRRKLTKYQAGRIYQGKPKGLVLGNYVVLDKIGEGGMGEVFKAEHRRMKRIVAIKTLPAALTESEKSVKRFQREVEAAARLVHPNIVTAFDADEFEGTYYLVMEFVDGQNLAALVKKEGPLSVERGISCIIQAARGLSFAHSQGIIHRDIKPHNLLMDKSGTVKILDMGLVRLDTGEPDSPLRTKLTYQDQIVGTVDYMSPEQADDTNNVDQRSDVYSLGCTLYRLLTGRPPYDGESTIQKLLAHREYAAPPLRAIRKDVPDELERIYQKMVAKSQDDRFQSMNEVIRALEGRGAESDFDINQPVLTTRGTDVTLEVGGATGTAVASPTSVSRKNRTNKEVTVTEIGETDTHSDHKRPPTPPPPPRRAKAGNPSTLVIAAAGAALLLLAAAAYMAWSFFSRPTTLVINWPLSERTSVKLVIDGTPKRLGSEERLEFPLEPGIHAIEIKRKGYLTIKEELELAPREQKVFKLKWKRIEFPPRP